MAEQTSCTKPGKVSAAERAPPPGSGCASRTSTLRPARARTIAAASPLGPAPTTTASYPAAIARLRGQRTRRSGVRSRNEPKNRPTLRVDYR